MYRSVSWSQVSDDYIMHSSSPKGVSGPRMSAAAAFMNGSELPVYDPIMDLAKKEKSRAKFSENATWTLGVKVADSVAARIEGLTIEGDIDTDSDGTQTSSLPVETVEVVDTKNHPKHRNKALNHRSFH